MADLSSGEGPALRPAARGPLFYIGAAGLATATLVDSIAVAGRWLSMPLHGALEIIQAAVLVTACVSMMTATVASSHAIVRLLLNRVSPRTKAVLTRAGWAVSAVLFVGLTVASVWLTIEHWHGHEESELLHVPLRPLRLLCSLSMLFIAAVSSYRAIEPRGVRR